MDRDEAIALGLIDDSYDPGAAPLEDFNTQATASVAGLGPRLVQQLENFFGDLVAISGNEVKLNV